MAIRTLSICLAWACLLGGCAGPAASPVGGPEWERIVEARDFDRAILDRALVEAANAARREHALAPLGRQWQLDRAAEEQASHMALLFRAEHTNPIAGEHTVSDRIRAVGLDGSRSAENAMMLPLRPVGKGALPPYTYRTLALAVVGAWLESPGHRRNLLDPGFSLAGTASRVSTGLPGDVRVFSALVFLEPLANTLHPTPRDTTVTPKTGRGP